MKMLVTNEWLQFRIAKDPDVDTDAGLPIEYVDLQGEFAKTAERRIEARFLEEARADYAVLGTLIRQLRVRDEISIAELADYARVSVDELQAIEHDPRFIPKPRTIHQLASYYKISTRLLLRISTASVKNDPVLDEAVTRFAANSGELSSLSKEERKRLNEFVSFLSKYRERTGDHEK
ncbi:MAG: helix-turn-helix transcriptional regulator [Sulfuricaulis sp.]|uniref:helix-turn-helix domain-containing protein n=1 Tax=Sulfuricaulis sp. TaxID=2003553 RepID=UPI0025D9E90E|nr:helix-turn-helix transcriptional regulator [Sulfuricaulis sp.]MCR4347720.1 helix-turn-helix transcriptional regulator [Sulfuricaulis sp.]